MRKVTISTLNKMKAEKEKFVCITAYDATFARLIGEAGAETFWSATPWAWCYRGGAYL